MDEHLAYYNALKEGDGQKAYNIMIEHLMMPLKVHEKVREKKSEKKMAKIMKTIRTGASFRYDCKLPQIFKVCKCIPGWER